MSRFFFLSREASPKKVPIIKLFVSDWCFKVIDSLSSLDILNLLITLFVYRMKLFLN